jgi:8-oxo-dGTP diphosphatase/putative hydrolase of the HAD superfamily
MNGKLAELEWIFFDIGSTLTDEGPFEKCMFNFVYERMREARIAVGRRTFEDVIREVVEKRKLGTGGYRSLIEKLVLAFTNDIDQAQKVVYAFNLRVSAKYVEMQVPYHETKEVLKTLASRYGLGVIANQPREAAQFLNKLRLSEYLDVVVLSDLVGFAKPDSRIFLRALEEAKCKPEKAMMVGDRLDNDIAPAKSVGMLTTRVKRGMMTCQVPLSELERPDYEIDSLQDLLMILRLSEECE